MVSASGGVEKVAPFAPSSDATTSEAGPVSEANVELAAAEQVADARRQVEREAVDEQPARALPSC